MSGWTPGKNIAVLVAFAVGGWIARPFNALKRALRCR